MEYIVRILRTIVSHCLWFSLHLGDLLTCMQN